MAGMGLRAAIRFALAITVDVALGPVPSLPSQLPVLLFDSL